jgi:hypothetical protein
MMGVLEMTRPISSAWAGTTAAKPVSAKGTIESEKRNVFIKTLR